MDAALTAHAPVLVNTVGHSLGVLLFGLSLYFLLRDRSGIGRRGSSLSVAAAGLALLWNLASLLVLFARERGWSGVEFFVALSTSALSALPAVLLHVALGSRFRWIVRAGYAIGGVAVLMHATEHLLVPHRTILLITTVGYGALTVVAVLRLLFARDMTRDLTRRLTAAMALFLFAMSLVHVDAGEAQRAWSMELLVHHAGVPMALLVLLQDYRFVLVDAFVRVLASILLAAAMIVAAWPWLRIRLPESPIDQGLLLVGASLGLVIYALVSAQVQRFLTRIIFGRPDVERTAERLRELCSAASDEAELIRAAAEEMAAFLSAELCQVELDRDVTERLLFPAATAEFPPPVRARLEAAGVEIVTPLRFGPSDVRLLMFGRRRGGRRYLSEDLQAAERLASQVLEHVEHFREAEMRRLVAQAELRALESQIHPHFLFNALNTLYGVIPKDAAGARRTVLNLADILRYFLRADKTYIPLEEELRIVEAYLAIEKLRLGERLRMVIDVEESARRTLIPVLSLQPLVENAVKHAIATQPAGGEVRIAARRESEGVRVLVEDSGPGFGASGVDGGLGVGLQNVARRLKLCFGPTAELHIDSSARGTRVDFLAPVERVAA
ncbi:MAG: histidine kinase [Proteobacteria bacterium]|nr:histidine kinase [Pseudomonadota bacterium]